MRFPERSLSGRSGGGSIIIEIAWPCNHGMRVGIRRTSPRDDVARLGVGAIPSFGMRCAEPSSLELVDELDDETTIFLHATSTQDQ